MAALSERFVRGFCIFNKNCASSYVGVQLQSRNTSSNVPIGGSGIKPSTLKRGTGGRSSFNGVTATIFGSSGFVGRYLVNELAKCGTQLILPYRCDFFEIQRLKVAGDLGQILFYPFDIRDEKSIAKSMEYSNVVINLIGKDNETSHFKFKDVHIDGARRIARLARESGVQRLIHFSALNCTEKPKPVIIPSGSKFLASKWQGEQAVLDEFPEAIIFRPADIYGHEDRFVRYYSHFVRRSLCWIGLWKRGKGIVKQPVCVHDVAKAVRAAIFDQDLPGGSIVQAVGPKRHELNELVDYMFRVMRRKELYYRYDLRLDPSFFVRVALGQLLYPKYPVLNFERLEREHITDEISFDHLFLPHLGVEPLSVEERMPFELKYFRQAAYFDPELFQFDREEPPKSIPY